MDCTKLAKCVNKQLFANKFPFVVPVLCVAHMWSKMFNVALSLDYVKQNVPQIERSESWLGKLYTVLYYG